MDRMQTQSDASFLSNLAANKENMIERININ